MTGDAGRTPFPDGRASAAASPSTVPGDASPPPSSRQLAQDAQDAQDLSLPRLAEFLVGTGCSTCLPAAGITSEFKKNPLKIQYPHSPTDRRDSVLQAFLKPPTSTGGVAAGTAAEAINVNLGGFDSLMSGLQEKGA